MKACTPITTPRCTRDYYQWAQARASVTARMTTALATYIRFEVEGFEGWRRARARRPQRPRKG